MSALVHSSAVIDPSVELGTDVKIGAFAFIGPNVKIGDRTEVGHHASISMNTELGEENKIFPYASLGTDPQDLKFKGEPSLLILGNRNTVREFATLNRGTEHGEMKTVIGDENLLMASSHVGHDCILGNNNIVANSSALAGHVELGSRVNISGLVGVHQFCRIGDNVYIGAGSMVALDIPPFCMAVGDRCMLRGLNLVGLQRAGYSPEDISAAKKAYRQLFGSVGKLEPRIEAMEPEFREHELVKRLIEFIVASERGIAQPAKQLSS